MLSAFLTSQLQRGFASAMQAAADTITKVMY